MYHTNGHPRILLISHNVLGKSDSMNRFLHDTFRSWPVDKLCQLYIHSEIPTTTDCVEYYRVTDFDVLRSITRFQKPGQRFTEKDIVSDALTARVRSKTENLIYEKGRQRTPFMRMGRNFLWCLGTWKTKALDQWVRNCQPDLIYFASGDYVFTYHIVEYLSNKFKLPVFTAIYDDYYFSAKRETLAEKMQFRQYKGALTAMLKHSRQVSYASPVMKEKYDKAFNLNGVVQYKSAKISNLPEIERESPIVSYVGGLSLKRWKSLVEIGKATVQIRPQLLIDIYSGETNPEILRHMTVENGIRFHGRISAEAVETVIDNSNLLLIVESFDEETTKKVKCSLSTKVADYLGSNRCILAYGPKEVGAMSYLRQNKCAAMPENMQQLDVMLQELIAQPELRRKYAEIALQVAKENHAVDVVHRKLHQVLSDCIK